MRSEKELWLEVLNNRKLFESGLCRWVALCREFNVIDFSEYFLLRDIISKKRDNPLSYWIGFPGQIKPRIKWIENRIKQIENEQKQQIPK